MYENYLFYDIEVFSHDVFVIFKNVDKKIIRVFRNNFAGLSEFIKNKILVGYNNYYYDDKIMVYMLDQKPVSRIKELNDQLIAGEDISFLKRPKFESLDCYQQLDKQTSLKKIEGNMGREILESSVPFTIDRPLTKKEFRNVFKYCSYDVDTTIDIFKMREASYFQPKKYLIDMLGKPAAMRWNTTTISANLLLKSPLPKWSNIRVPEEMMDLVPQEVYDLWMEMAHSFKEETLKKTINIEEFNCDIQFGFGGLHGAHKTIKRTGKVKLLDVKSMYPAIILLLKCLGHASDKYKEILIKRLAAKGIDDVLAEALKLILNSVYGNLNNQYSMLFNFKAAMSVCLYGQIALFELCKYLSQFCTIININTDGVAFIPHDAAYVDAYKLWEKEFSLELEEKEFSQFIQKDVNNYIAVQGDKLICKGGDVSRYQKDAIFKNNNARILDIALVNKLVFGKDEIDTFRENLDKPHLFQYILKAGPTYKSTSCEEGKEYNKVNRVFASKQEGFCLFKRRNDDGLVRFADTPNHMFLWNQDCNDLKNFENIVDLNHYNEIVRKRLERWI